MAGERPIFNIDGLVRERFDAAEQTRQYRLTASATARDEITHRAYGHSLRNCVSRPEVREIVRGFREAVPRLNREPIRFGSMKELCARAAIMSECLGADFRVGNMSWPSGLALWGFYLSRGSGLQERALICVNAAHHRTAVAMAFAHELGHHVAERVFGTRAHLPYPLRYTGFESHLDNPLELAADIGVSLALYPRNAARKIFPEVARETKETAEQRLGSATRAAADDVWHQTGLDRASLTTQKRVQYRDGLIHFTRLRQALIHQYGI